MPIEILEDIGRQVGFGVQAESSGGTMTFTRNDEPL